LKPKQRWHIRYWVAALYIATLRTGTYKIWDEYVSFPGSLHYTLQRSHHGRYAAILTHVSFPGSLHYTLQRCKVFLGFGLRSLVSFPGSLHYTLQRRSSKSYWTPRQFHSQGRCTIHCNDDSNQAHYLPRHSFIPRVAALYIATFCRIWFAVILAGMFHSQGRCTIHCNMLNSVLPHSGHTRFIPRVAALYIATGRIVRGKNGN